MRARRDGRKPGKKASSGWKLTLKRRLEALVRLLNNKRNQRLLAGVLVVSLLALWFGLHPASKPKHPASPPSPPGPTVHAPATRRPGTGQPGRFEEHPSSLEQQARLVDSAILQTMRGLGLDSKRIATTDTEPRVAKGQEYLFRTEILDLPEPGKFVAALREALASVTEGASLAQAESDVVLVSLSAIPTHRLILRTIPALPGQPEEKPMPEQHKKRLAIVIDDLGEDLSFARALAGLDFPVAFSILPGRAHTAETARIAARAGRDVLLHLPMEPLDSRNHPGPGALTTAMTADQIARTLAGDLAQVPGIAGVNNHMGSRFTESSASLAQVLAILKEHGLFFLDSMTTPRSKGAQEASRLGLPFYRRDVFLDNERDVQAILGQLRKAEQLAMRGGQAICIGHPHAETLAALRLWASQHNGVQIVTLTSLPPEH